MKRTTLENEFADAMRAISNPTKLTILLTCYRQALSITDLVGLVGQNSKTTTYHIAELRRLGYVTTYTDPGDTRALIVKTNKDAEVVKIAIAASRKIRQAMEKRYKQK